DVLRIAGWLIALGPVPVVAAAVAWWTERDRLWEQRGVLRPLVVGSGLERALLVFCSGGPARGGVLLSALSFAIARAGARRLARLARRLPFHRHVVSSVAILGLPLAVAVRVAHAYEDPFRARLDDLARSAEAVPEGGVLVTGQVCPALELHETLRALESGTDG